jgi:hypothetical protein
VSSEAAPEVRIVGYCRACGKALDEGTVRRARGTIYCGEHVPPEEPPAPGPSYGAPEAGAAPYGSPYSNAVPPPLPGSGDSPGLAFLLGLIPGVGAIYNGQYVKGLIHVFILGLLFTIASSGPGNMAPMMGLMIPGFWAYMAFEAYHTARKKRLGLPVDEFSGLSSRVATRGFPAAPVLLIVFGVVFLLNNLEILELRRLLRYWPVLMIALGAYLLWIRMSAAQRSNGPGGGGT